MNAKRTLMSVQGHDPYNNVGVELRESMPVEPDTVEFDPWSEERYEKPVRGELPQMRLTQRQAE